MPLKICHPVVDGTARSLTNVQENAPIHWLTASGIHKKMVLEGVQSNPGLTRPGGLTRLRLEAGQTSEGSRG